MYSHEGACSREISTELSAVHGLYNLALETRIKKCGILGSRQNMWGLHDQHAEMAALAAYGQILVAVGLLHSYILNREIQHLWTAIRKCCVCRTNVQLVDDTNHFLLPVNTSLWEVNKAKGKCCF